MSVLTLTDDPESLADTLTSSRKPPRAPRSNRAMGTMVVKDNGVTVKDTEDALALVAFAKGASPLYI